MDMAPEILLKAYVQHQSEDAFRELVAKTLDEVYSSSLRIVQGTPPLAQEIAVRVYLELARKAPGLGKDVVVASWLRERTCKTAVSVLSAEDRQVDRAVLKREKNSPSIPGSADPAPAGLAKRICYAIFLNKPRHKGFRRLSPAAWWPASIRPRWPVWIRPRHLYGAVVCVLIATVWWNNPFHRRNRIMKPQGPELTPSSIAQLSSPDYQAFLTPTQMANTNDGLNLNKK